MGAEELEELAQMSEEHWNLKKGGVRHGRGVKEFGNAVGPFMRS